MTRLYIDQPIIAGASITLDERAARHVTTVLRLRAGDPLVLFNGNGGEFQATVAAVTRGAVNVSVYAYIDVDRESPLTTTLVQALARGERMDYTIQKAVELGITRIVPVLGKRSVVRLEADRAQRRADHWQGIVIAACEQCGRTRLPGLDPLIPLAEWLQSSSLAGSGIYLQAGAPSALAACRDITGACTLFAGPEGGFAPEEIDMLDAAGCRAMSLGPRILRSETAALVALSILQSRSGDLC